MATSTPFKEGYHQKTSSYKNMWARYVAQKSLDKDKQVALNLIAESDLGSRLGIVKGQQLSVSELVEKTKEDTGNGFVPDSKGNISVGIVGAGVAGLFTALLFDWINADEECQKHKLHIEYDILEAADKDRLGGRLYTHRFSDKEHDYYDVGAMRFPNNSIMKRTFQLFNYIGLRPGKRGLIPYYYDDELKVCPSYFNDVGVSGDAWIPEGEDPFRINIGLPENGKIPDDLLRKNPADLVAAALGGFIKLTRETFDRAIHEINEEAMSHNEAERPNSRRLWDLLTKADHMSVRQFLASGNNTTLGIPDGPEYNYNTIEWLETATLGTGWYNQSLTECVLEELDFRTPQQKLSEEPVNHWWCIDGGAQKIAEMMAEKMQGEIQFKSQVTAINAQIKKRSPGKYTPMKLQVNKTNSITGEKTAETKDYFAVFNSTTLGALQRMNLKNAGLLWGTKQAIRALGYGASCKVAIKFKSAWWQKEPFGIKKGGVARTDLPLRVCVYPSYNLEASDNDESAVLLCSYTWGQDAQRIGALISPDSPQNEEQLKSVMLHNLALLHAKDEPMSYDRLLPILQEQYLTHHAWDWYKDENMSGAFAYFGPGQFSNMWQEIIKPNAFGQLYFIGEAASSHHAWIVGALESVIRATYIMFQGLEKHDPTNVAYKRVLSLLSQTGDEEHPAGGDGHDYSRGVFGGERQETDPVTKPTTLPSSLPFYPLPEEMPARQLDTDQHQPLTSNPQDDIDKPQVSLTFNAAVVYMCMIESYISFKATLSL